MIILIFIALNVTGCHLRSSVVVRHYSVVPLATVTNHTCRCDRNLSLCIQPIIDQLFEGFRELTRWNFVELFPEKKIPRLQFMTDLKQKNLILFIWSKRVSCLAT